MPDINKVLVTASLKPENQEKLGAVLAPAEVTFCRPQDHEVIGETMKTADVAILESDLDEVILAGPNLKWVHCCRAGLDKSARPEIFDRGIIVTSSSGRSAPALAEHALMFMLSLTYDVPLLLRAQADHHWAATREYFYKTGLYGKTIGIVGMGKTGCEVARLAKAFDMQVLGWRWSKEWPEHFDKVYSAQNGDSLQPLMEVCDYLVLSVELNDDTWHLIGKKELAWLSPNSYVINMGRGELVDEPELIRALQEGRIAGAGLDTFEVEPLPEHSPLWDLPNVLITPHITPRLPDREERALEYVYQNVEAYRNGSGYVNQLTKRSVYTKGMRRD